MKTLGLFFTQGISVSHWHRKGLLDREKQIYEAFIRNGTFDNIYWFSYGVRDHQFETDVVEGIKIIGKPWFLAGGIGSIVYSFLLPILRRKYLRRCRIYKTNQIWGSWTAVMAKWLYKKPVVARSGFTESLFALHRKNRGLYRRRKAIEEFAYRHADWALVASLEDRQYVAENFKCRHVTVTRNFIDTGLFRPMAVSKDRDIVFVGRLAGQKNLLDLIRAVNKSGYRLDIYGSGISKRRREIVSLIAALKAEDTITLQGVVPNRQLPAILNRYKLYVLPSLYEGMPKTLLEAMACGCCCLGTDVTGINEIILHRDNGWLCAADAGSLERAIRQLMGDSNLREQLGLCARETVLNYFALERVMEVETDVYRRLEG